MFFFNFLIGKKKLSNKKNKLFKITLKIENIKIEKSKKKECGFIYISIFTNKKNYLINAKKKIFIKAFKKIKLPVTNLKNKLKKKVISLSLKINLPKGKYGITCFYDKNNDKKMNFLFTLPTEQYGFGNFNNKLLLTQPKFKDFCFQITNKQTVLMRLY